MATVSKEAKTALSFTATGKSGATATPVTLAGGTASGAPSSGAHLKGEIVLDDTGAGWYCTVAGTPGTWVSIGGGTVSSYYWNGSAYVADTDVRIFLGPAAQNPKVASGGRDQTNDIWITTDTLPDVLSGLDSPAVFNDVFGSTLPTGATADSEFDRSGGSNTSLPTGWSWLNQGTATYLERAGAGAVILPTTPGQNMRGITVPVPSAAAWTCYAKISGTMDYAFNNSYGIILSDGTKCCTLQQDMGSAVRAIKWANFVEGTPSAIANIGNGVESTRYLVVRKNSASSWDFGIMVAGSIRWFVTAHDLSTHMTTTVIGFYAEANGDGGNPTAACSWMRFR